MKKKAWSAAILALPLLFSSPAWSATTDAELKVIFKTASLCKNVPAGGTEIAVVYDPSNSKSKSDYDVISGAIGSGTDVKGSTYTFKAVDVNNIGSINNKLILVTEGLGSDVWEKIHSTAKTASALTVSTDMACVNSGKCALGVDVGSGVTITLNSGASNDIGLSFDAAFEFMVKEI